MARKNKASRAKIMKRILSELGEVGALTMTEMHAVTGNRWSSTRMIAALDALLATGKIRAEKKHFIKVCNTTRNLNSRIWNTGVLA